MTEKMKYLMEGADLKRGGCKGFCGLLMLTLGTHLTGQAPPAPFSTTFAFPKLNGLTQQVEKGVEVSTSLGDIQRFFFFFLHKDTIEVCLSPLDLLGCQQCVISLSSRSWLN